MERAVRSLHRPFRSLGFRLLGMRFTQSSLIVSHGPSFHQSAPMSDRCDTNLNSSQRATCSSTVHTFPFPLPGLFFFAPAPPPRRGPPLARRPWCCSVGAPPVLDDAKLPPEDWFHLLLSPPPAPPRSDIVGRGIAPRRAPAAGFSRARVRPDFSDSVSLGGAPPTGALFPGAPPAPAPASVPLALPQPTAAAATNVGATEPAPPPERSSEVARRAPERAASRGLYSTQRSEKRGGLGGGVFSEASASFTRHACKRRTNFSTPSSLARRKPAKCGRRSVRAFLEGVGAASTASMASVPPSAAPDLAGATASTPVVAADSGRDAQSSAVVGVPPGWDVATAVAAPVVPYGGRAAAPTAGGGALPKPPAVAGSSARGGEDSCHGLRTRWYRKPGGRGESGGNGAASLSADFGGGESGMTACRVARRMAPRQQWTHRPSTAKEGGCTAVAERAAETGHVQRTPSPVRSPQANSRTHAT